MKNKYGLFLSGCGLALAIAVTAVMSGTVPDVAAAPRFEKKCEDGVDNDQDGLIDADDPDCSGDSGGNTGNGQDTPADVYIYHAGPYGILGDNWADGGPGDPALNPSGEATLYPADNSLSGIFSCAKAIVTDQALGSVRMFVPVGDTSSCPAPNRFLRIASQYDLDQDGLCVYPYSGRRQARGFERYYDCSAGPEPDGLEEVMVTMLLDEVLGPGNSTPAVFLIRLLDYGDSYVPDPGSDPGLTDIEFIGSQERAFAVTLDGVTSSVADPSDPEVRVFENAGGMATICEVVWKNARAHDCKPIVDRGGSEVSGMAIKGKVDPTPLP
jgi:hypothetical protein